jgi:hypothetical protein
MSDIYSPGHLAKHADHAWAAHELSLSWAAAVITLLLSLQADLSTVFSFRNRGTLE